MLVIPGRTGYPSPVPDTVGMLLPPADSQYQTSTP